MTVYRFTAGIILLISIWIMASTDDPLYTDAFYYYNAAERLAHGEGLTDPYLWNFINAPDELPTASHRYWMPLASLVAALPMIIFGSSYTVAQIAYIPFWVGLAWLTIWLMQQLSDKRRHHWIAGLCVVFGGFYFPFWITTDTFLIYGVVGAGALILIGRGRESLDWRLFAAAGVCSGLAHLARADGLLFVIVGLMVIIWRIQIQKSLRFGAALIGGYLLIMLPWFVRNLNVIDAPLPSGGVGTIFLRGYNDLFSYDPSAWTPAYFLDWGLEQILESRLEGGLVAFQTWLAVEGFIILAPLALWMLIQKRRDGFWMGVIWYAIGLHLAMGLVFTFPGSRGGLFHSSTALFPFWIALGILGLDALIEKLGKWRRWNIRQAQTVFGLAVILLPLFLSLSAWGRQQQATSPNYSEYQALLPEDARIMANDPAEWYYYTDWIGVTVPDDDLDTVKVIAERYCLTHLILDENVTESLQAVLSGEQAVPPYLTQIAWWGQDTETWQDDVQIYTFDIECNP